MISGIYWHYPTICFSRITHRGYLELWKSYQQTLMRVVWYLCVSLFFCDLVLRCLQAQDFPNPEIWVWNRGSPSWIPGVFFFDVLWECQLHLPFGDERVYHMNARGNMIEKETIILCPILFDLFGDELLEIFDKQKHLPQSVGAGSREIFSWDKQSLDSVWHFHEGVYWRIAYGCISTPRYFPS